MSAAQTAEVRATPMRRPDPVAQVRDAKSWEYGPFVNWGNGVGDRSDYKFFWAGFQMGKATYPGHSCRHS